VAQGDPTQGCDGKVSGTGATDSDLDVGTPVELLSNQGPEFVAELNCNLSRQWGIKQQYAIAYHPQMNRQVE